MVFSAPAAKPLFSIGLNLANWVVSSDILGNSWAAMSELQSQIDRNYQSQSTPSSETVKIQEFEHPEYKIIAFVTPPVASSHLQQEGDLVPSSSSEASEFQFLCSEDSPRYAINKAAIYLFNTLRDKLSPLKDQVVNPRESIPHIITGDCLGGSIASLFTLWLLHTLGTETTDKSMTKDKSIGSSSMEERPTSPQNQIPTLSEQTDSTGEQQPLAHRLGGDSQHSADGILAPIPAQVSGPIQWPPGHWYPVQGPWAIGSEQTRAQPYQYGSSGEERPSSFGAQNNRSGQNHPPRETDLTDGSGRTNSGQRSGSILGNPNPFLGPAFPPYAFPMTGGGRPEPGDPLYISPADGPELRLITMQLTGPETYNAWARDLHRALVTKDKDGFLDGAVPFSTDERLQRHWRKCNQLVRTWIGNCLAPDVAAGLPPTEDSKKFWENIREKYGRLDRARLFTITQALSELKQGNLSVTACFNRLSALWNELEAAEERLEGPEATLRQYKEIKERKKATRFLLILNESFSSFRSQILAMDPAPSLGRIYQLAVQEENQRLAAAEHVREGVSLAAFSSRGASMESTKGGGSFGLEKMGMAAASGQKGGNPSLFQMDGWDNKARSNGYRGPTFSIGSDGSCPSITSAGLDSLQEATSAPILKGNSLTNSLKGNSKGKGKFYCDFCKRPNHTRKTCWKLHEKPGEKGKRGSFANQVTRINFDQLITDNQYQQIMRVLKQLETSDKRAGFSGTSYCLNSIPHDAWIIDSGASDHIICDERFFSHTHQSHFAESVQLPNGNTTCITKVGTVKLSPSITLQNVLYVPKFKFNLISVSKVCKDNSCHIFFNSETCFFKAHSTGKLMGLGYLSQGLYFWTKLSENYDLSCIPMNKIIV